MTGRPLTGIMNLELFDKSFDPEQANLNDPDLE